MIDSKKIGTIELNTGLEISGVFTDMIKDEDNNVVFFRTEGPTALANREQELIGHGTEAHVHGFSSPIGRLKGISLAIEDMGPRDLKAYNFYDGKRISFEYESGIIVEGLNVTGIRNIHGKLILIQFEDCTVTYNDEVLFKPEYGTFDLAVGSSIVSAYAGSADFRSFDNLHHVSDTKTIKIEKDSRTLELENLYKEVRDMRADNSYSDTKIETIFNTLKNNHTEDWLLTLELLELVSSTQNSELKEQLTDRLTEIKNNGTDISHLIESGLQLLN